MPDDEIELEHAKSFLDVVFGVLIALPLTEVFPQLLSDVITKRSLSSAGSLLLLTATIVFSTFYWFEVRRFIDEQSKFDRAIGVGGLPLVRLFGSLIMVALVAIIIKFASLEALRAFLIANLFFWLIDLFGNIQLRRRYKNKDIESIRNEYPDEYEWYTNSFKPYKGVPYSGLNLAVFGLLLVGDYIFHEPGLSKFIAACLVFVFTLLRHLILRTKL